MGLRVLKRLSPTRRKGSRVLSQDNFYPIMHVVVFKEKK